MRHVAILILKIICTKSALKNTNVVIVMQKTMELMYVSSLSYTSQQFKIFMIYSLYHHISFLSSTSSCLNFHVIFHYQDLILKLIFSLLILQKRLFFILLPPLSFQLVEYYCVIISALYIYYFFWSYNLVACLDILVH